MMTMNKIIALFTLIITIGLTSTYAQTGVLSNTPEYKAHADGWLVDINEAYEISKKTGKPIMANFTGSDWCGWCKKLKAEVFDKADFKAWAEKTVVLVELDFPRRFKVPENIRQQNAGLQQAFQVTGYPTIWVFDLGKDEKGQYTINAMGKTGYVQGVTAFTSGVDAMIKQAAANKK
jgi:thioredoxin-related protein